MRTVAAVVQKILALIDARPSEEAKAIAREVRALILSEVAG